MILCGAKERHLELSTMLTLSTSHISEDAGKILASEPSLCCYKKSDYGWFIPTNNLSNFPDSVKACLDYALSIGADWLILDCDGPTIPELPVYDW